MKLFSRTANFLMVAFFVESCSLLGVHFQVHNPKNPGKPPTFSEEAVLLGEMSKYRSCFDVFYYDLSVTLQPSDKSLSGIVEIHSTAQEDFDTLQIDLHPNFEITQLIDKENGRELKYHRKERAVFINIPKEKNEKFIIKIGYRGKPVEAEKAPWKGGFVWKKDKDGNPWVGVACESDGASIWWPLKDHTADEPDSIRLHYTVPKNLVAVGNGQLERIDETDLNAIYHWFVSYPINTYNVTIYAGNFKLLTDEYIGINNKKLVLNHYVHGINYEKAKMHFQQLHPILKLFEEKFGEYPWYNDGFKLVESPYAGMEHQTAIAYGNGYKNNTSETDYIILHETAHEWWGNSVTARDLADVWIQEGFATYAEALYFESKDGKAGYDNHLAFYKLFIKNKYPVVGIKDRRWFHYKKNSDVYMKEAWILHTLRNQIDNDRLFFDIIKTFAEKFKYQLVDSKDFIELVNQKTNHDYNWFFNHYLHRNVAPELEYATTKDGILFYRWSNVSSEFNQLKLKIRTQDQEFTIIPTNEVQHMVLPKNSSGGWNYQFYNNVLCAFDENKDLLKKK